MGQALLRARQFGDRRTMAAATYHDAEILWIVPLDIARHLRQAPLAVEAAFRPDAMAIAAAVNLAQIHYQQSTASAASCSVPQIGASSLYARINPETFAIVETFDKKALGAMVPLLGGYRYARLSNPMRVAICSDAPLITDAVMAGGAPLLNPLAFFEGKVRLIGSVALAAGDPLLLQMALLATLPNLAGGVIDGHSAHIALMASTLKAQAADLSRLRAADLWLYRLLTQRNASGTDLGIDAAKPLPELMVSVYNAIAQNAEVMPDYDQVRAVCAALSQPISSFRLRQFDDPHEWDVYEELVDTLAPNMKIGTPAARSELPLQTPGAQAIVDNLQLFLGGKHRLAHRTFDGSHHVSIFEDGPATFLIAVHENDSIEIVSWVNPTEPAVAQSS